MRSLLLALLIAVMGCRATGVRAHQEAASAVTTERRADSESVARDGPMQQGAPSPQALACSPRCAAPQSCCAGACADQARDALNCGACGQRCGDGEGCCQGTCVAKVTGVGAPLVTAGACLSYRRYANRGQTAAVHVLPDFSHAGYQGGGVALPAVPVRLVLGATPGDNRERVQAALDAVAQLPADAAGLRGAVLLLRGLYDVGAGLRIDASGVVLRGEGQGQDGTILRATYRERDPLIRIQGKGPGFVEVKGAVSPITNELVPVGAARLDVADAAVFRVGDRIGVRRTPNQDWIEALDPRAFDYDGEPEDGNDGAKDHPWTPRSYTIDHVRRIRAIEGSTITLDIPIVDAMERQYGSGKVVRLLDGVGFVEQCGVENLRLDSTNSGKGDEDHAWSAVQLSFARHSWVKRVTARHFAFSAVAIGDPSAVAGGYSEFNTVEECAFVDPVSKVVGGRRYAFTVQSGMGNLFQRCYARDARHSFASSSRVTGPNVWLDCAAQRAHSDEGPHHRWATGLLFDNVRTARDGGGRLAEFAVQNRLALGSGHGWAGAQVLFWNVEAESIICDAPPGAMNWTMGAVGAKRDSRWTPEEPFGWWEHHGAPILPRSLYLSQLQDRLGPAAVDATTIASQRSGRIWAALARWAGEGELAAFSCTDGVAAGRVCCSASCGRCGGDGCSRREGGSASCCGGVIEAAGRSCREHPAPCVMDR